MWKIINNQNWDNIKATFQWIQDMHNVPQDSIFHAEGDVLTHTRMVVEALINLEEYQLLGDQDQQILFAAALLHDVEKRSTTVIESDGRITSRNHARKGEYTARMILYKNIPTPFYIREAIAKLVRYHGLPLWIFERENPKKMLFQCSWEVNTNHLSILAKADVLGRICLDKNDLLYKIDLFKEFCIEQNCFGQKRHFETDTARFNYFQKANVSPNYVPFETAKNEVIIMCALPGTGKDFYIQKNYPDWEVISLDTLRHQLKIAPSDSKGNGRIGQLATENAKVLLRKKQSFIWNATNLTRLLRKKIIDIAVQYGAKVKIVYLEVPYAKLLQQNSNREYAVPKKIIEKMMNRLEMPSPIEADIVDYRDRY